MVSGSRILVAILEYLRIQPRILLWFENHTWGRKSLKSMRNCYFHYIILTSILYRVQILTSHNTEKSENSQSPHLREIKRMCKQCVPGAPPFVAHARDEAMVKSDPSIWLPFCSHWTSQPEFSTVMIIISHNPNAYCQHACFRKMEQAKSDKTGINQERKKPQLSQNKMLESLSTK